MLWPSNAPLVHQQRNSFHGIRESIDTRDEGLTYSDRMRS
jgi:hypothetical protein